MKKITSLLLLVLCLVPMLVLADDTVNTVGETVNEFLVGTVFPVIGAFLLALVGILINKIKTKYNLEISAATEEKLLNAAKQGIAYAEEKASSVVKEKVTKLTGKEKLDTAILYVLSVMPEVTPDQAESLVTSVLGSTKDVGATGDKAVS